MMRSGLPSTPATDEPVCPTCNNTGVMYIDGGYSNEWGDFVRAVDVVDCDECAAHAAEAALTEVDGDK